MKIRAFNAGWAVAAVLAVGGLVGGCSGNSASPPPGPDTTALSGLSDECKTFMSVYDSTASVAIEGNPQAAVDRWAQAASSFSTPQLKDAATKASQFYKQLADDESNPSGSSSTDDSSMKAVSDAEASCLLHK